MREKLRSKVAKTNAWGKYVELGKGGGEFIDFGPKI